MAAASYYAEPGMTQEKPQLLPENTHLEGHGSQPQGLGQEMHSETHRYPQQGYNQGYNEQSSGTYSGQQQQNMGQQQMGNTGYGQGAPQQQMNEQNNGVYSGQHQQQMGNSNYAQGAGQQQMNGGVGQAAEPDNRDTLTKCNDNPPDYVSGIQRIFVSVNGKSRQSCTAKSCLATDHRSCNDALLTLLPGLDKLEKKFGGERFNNQENAEKNRAMNANILKRLKQVGMMVM